MGEGGVIIKERGVIIRIRGVIIREVGAIIRKRGVIIRIALPPKRLLNRHSVGNIPNPFELLSF